MGSELDAQIRHACESADYALAATCFIEHHGGEILAFLGSRLRSRSSADEVFAVFAEKLWVGLPSFEWRASVRSWAYRLARNAANDYLAAAQHKPGRHVALTDNPALSCLVDRVRTTTAVYRQTPVKDRMRELRETLPADDQMLLILRVDQGMDFRELAVAMAQGDAVLSDVEVDREAARLRKRFERVKERLRDLARQAGLIT
ncbi:MAG TPA: sigma-70 family RNA polymerase sigma factor [Polyangiales bacterium]